MYVSTYNKEMPCGRGFEWKSKNGFLEKCLIVGENISIASVEWIDFMNNDPRFIDSNGNRQIIQSGWNGAEGVVGSYPVDGFVEVDETIYALQFDGCFWVRLCILKFSFIF
jgi:hypothetical protein